MTKDLSVTIIQSELYWEDKEKNISHFQKLIESAKSKSDLIVLPEMFTTGFSMQPNKFAEEMNGRSVNWMSKIASEHNSAIIGSVIIKEDDNYFNRLVFAKPNSNIEFYDKRHLFGMAGEDVCYTAGTDRKLFEYNGWKINALVCYDLRFPVWSRNDQDYNLLIYVANWPERRIEHWKVLLKARAIENQAYTVGVNRVGKDGNSIVYSGDSAIYNPLGEKISSTEPYKESIETIVLSKKTLSEIKEKLPFNKDGDAFKII